jgi:hypothetical protein
MQAFSTQRRHLATTRLRKIAAASLLVLTLITGCSHSMNEVDAGSVKAHLNPHPKERYELTFTVHDAPGPFDSVTADVLYVVNNPMCIPHDPFTGGQSKSPGVTRPIPLERIAPQTYRGEVTTDLLADEDLFGLGVCHWNVMSAGIGLVAHGVTFSAGIVRKEIEAENATSTYFAKESYSSGTADLGEDGRYLSPYVKSSPDKFFHVIVSAKRIAP